MIRLGVNWKKDTVAGEYIRIFSDETVRGYLGDNIKKILGEQGYLRYPGGIYAQELSLNLVYAEQDYLMPGFPIFYRFAAENGIKVMQQLPTTGYNDNGTVRKIKSSGSTVNWWLVDTIIAKTVSMIEWIRFNGYFENVVFWQIGNEEWHSLEGPLSHDEFAEIVIRYLKAIKELIPPERLIIAAQPGIRGGSNNWGYNVLKLLRDYGASGYFNGISTHIYPYFLNRPVFDTASLNFAAYCLGEELKDYFIEAFDSAVLMLDSLGYDDGVKVHVTEMAIDVAGPQRNDGYYTYDNNEKNYFAAVAAARGVLSICSRNRFAGAAYYCLMHKYLISPEEYNPTVWKDYTKVDDWGWGQCWYLPFQEGTNKFVNTPLLEAWGLLGSFLNGAKEVGSIYVGTSINTYIAASKEREEIRCLFFNASDEGFSLNLSGGTGKALNAGSLYTRAIPLGDYGDGPLSQLRPNDIDLNGYVALKPFSLLFASGTDIRFNNIKLVPDFSKTEAYGADGEPLPFGEFYVALISGKLIPFPEGSTIVNYPLQLVEGMVSTTIDNASWAIFFIEYENLAHWSVGYE